MNYLRLLEKVFEDKACEYWILARRNERRSYGRWEHEPDSIVFASLPYEITKHRGNDPQDLSVRDVDRLGSLEIVTNIFLSENYTPFQHGQSFRAFYDGFAIKGVDVNTYLERARQLKSHDLYDYKALMETMQKETPAAV